MYAHERKYIVTSFQNPSLAMCKILYRFNQSYSMVSELVSRYTYILLMVYVSPQRRLGHDIVACFVYPHIPVSVHHRPGRQNKT